MGEDGASLRLMAKENPAEGGGRYLSSRAPLTMA